MPTDTDLIAAAKLLKDNCEKYRTSDKDDWNFQCDDDCPFKRDEWYCNISFTDGSTKYWQLPEEVEDDYQD